MRAHSPAPLAPAAGPHEIRLPAENPKVLALEAELDDIWPGWRQKQRFDGCAYDLKARIKWCLKRLSLLAEGLDYDVLIVRDARNASQCYAHPVLPATAQYEQVTREPPSPLGVRSSAATDVRLHGAAEGAALEQARAGLAVVTGEGS